MLQQSTLSFLSELKEHNTKEWFDSNKKVYEIAKKDFAQLVDGIIAEFGKTDATIAHLTAKDCVFRINRDVRFSADKSPYKINMGASINPGGRKSMQAGYYFHCEPGDKSFVGGGLYMAEPESIKKVRQEIDYNFADFEKILKGKPFVKEYNGELERGEGMSLIREPKGYEKDNPAIEYIKLKSWVAMTPLSDAALTDKTLVHKIATAFAALQPLIIFLNKAME